MKPSEKDGQPSDVGDLEQTNRIMEGLVRTPLKPQGEKQREDKKDDDPSAKKCRRLAPLKPEARAAVTQADDLSPFAPRLRELRINVRNRQGEQRTTCPQCSPGRKKPKDPCLLVKIDGNGATYLCWHCGFAGGILPEDISARAMAAGRKPPSSDLPTNSPTTLCSSAGTDQPSSDPHTSHGPFKSRDSFNKSSRDGRKSVMKWRHAPVLPPMGLAQRVNRVNAAMALFGAFGALALALALTSGTQPSLSAKDSHAQLAISEDKPQPKGVAETSPPASVLETPPQQAVNPDRLSRSVRAPQPAVADRLPDTRSLRNPVRKKVIEPDIPSAGKKPSTASRAAAISERVLKEIFNEEASKSPAPGNIAIDDDTRVGDIDTGGEVSAMEIDKASEQASDEAITEATDEAVTTTRLAAVRTDVNMRARPDNAAAVIMVVPGKSEVEIIGCSDWCEVVFAGKRGWIYHRFVGGAKSTTGMFGTPGVAGTTGRVAETTISTVLPARRAPVEIDGIGERGNMSA